MRTYRVIVTGSTILSIQHLTMDVRNHCLGIRDFGLGICDFHSGIHNSRLGIRNHRLRVRDRHVSVDHQLGLKAGWSVHELLAKPAEHTVKT